VTSNVEQGVKQPLRFIGSGILVASSRKSPSDEENDYQTAKNNWDQEEEEEQIEEIIFVIVTSFEVTIVLERESHSWVIEQVVLEGWEDHCDFIGRIGITVVSQGSIGQDCLIRDRNRALY